MNRLIELQQALLPGKKKSVVAKIEKAQEAITDEPFEEGYDEFSDEIETESDAPAVNSFSDPLFSRPGYPYSTGKNIPRVIKSQQVASRPVTINVVEESIHDNTYLSAKAAATPGCLRVTSVEDMVDKILRSLNSLEKIKQLSIFGHGHEGYVSVGAGQHPESKKQINGNPEWKPFLLKLKDKFMPNASVFLGGCHTGAGIEGAKKLKKLADLWGVSVSASTGLVYYDHEEPGAVHQVADPDKHTPKAIQPPSSETKILNAKMSVQHSLLPSMRNRISKIYIHPTDKPLGNVKDAKFKITDRQLIDKFLSGIDLSGTTDATRMNGTINGRIFFESDLGVEEYLVFAAFNFLLKKDEWESAYSLRWPLMEDLKNMLENAGNNSTNNNS